MSRRSRKLAADLERQQLIAERDAANHLAAERLRTIGRLCRTIDARDAALREANTPDVGWLADRRDLKRRNLELATTVRRLDARLIELQAANEYLCREAVDRAGTLRKVEVPA